MNKKYVLPFLLMALTLVACNPKVEPSTSSTSNSQDNSQTSEGPSSEAPISEDTSNSGSEVTVDPNIEETLINIGYTKVNGWPTTQVAAFLEESQNIIELPSLTTTDTFFYSINEDDNGTPWMQIVQPSQTNYYEQFKNALVNIGFTEETDPEMPNAFFGIDETGTIEYQSYLDVEVEQDGIVYPAGNYIDLIVSPYDGNVVVEDPLEDYEKVTGWPTTQINTAIANSGLEILDEVPAISIENETYFVAGEFFGIQLLEIFVPTATDELLTTVAGQIDATKYEVTVGDGELSANPTNQTLLFQGAFYNAADGYPDGIFFYIYLFGFDDSSAFDTLEIATGWPTEQVAIHMEENTNVIPSLAVEGETRFVHVPTGDFPAYLQIVLPGDSRVDEYKTILETAGYTVTADEEDSNYYLAVSEDGTVEIEFTHYLAGEGYPEATFIFLTAKQPAPVGVDGVATFDFIDERSLVSGTAALATWTVSPVSMKIEKNTSAQDVANFGEANGPFYSDPLRLYVGHKVTFTADEGYYISSVVVNAVSGRVLTAQEVVGATAVTSGTATTFTASENVSTISFVVGEKQTRWDSVVVNYLPIA